MRKLAYLIVQLSSIMLCAAALSQGTAFNYQGFLQSGGLPASGAFDLRFSLYDSASAGGLVAGPVTNSPTAVSNGLFLVSIDFGAGSFSGQSVFLDIGVRNQGSPGGYVALTPRQPVLSVPYAMLAQNARNLLGPVPAAQLPGNILTNGFSGATLNNRVTATTTNTIFIGVSGSNAMLGTYWMLNPTLCTNYTAAIIGPCCGAVQWWTNSAGYAICLDAQGLFLPNPSWGLAHTNYWFEYRQCEWLSFGGPGHPWAAATDYGVGGTPSDVVFGSGPFNPLSAATVNGWFSVTGQVTVAVPSYNNGPGPTEPLIEAGVLSASGGYSPQVRIASENDYDGSTNGAIVFFCDSRQGTPNLDMMQLSAWDLAVPPDSGHEGRIANVRFREPFPGGTNGGQIYLMTRNADGTDIFHGFQNGLFIDTNGEVVLGPKSYPIESSVLGYAAEVAGGLLIDGSLAGPTNATPPADPVHIRAWMNFTNSTGGVFKMPLYQ